MRMLVKYGGMLILMTGLWYGCFLGLSYWCYPPLPVDETLDTYRAKQTIWSVDRRYFLFNRHRFGAGRPQKLIVAGSSNAKEGFRPEELQPYFPDSEIHNVAFGGSVISEISEVTAFILDQLHEQPDCRATVVIGLWYGIFPAAPEFPNTPLHDEMLRYGLFVEEDGVFRPRIPRLFTPLALTMLRPVLLLSNPIRIGGLMVEYSRIVFEMLVRDHRLDFTPLLQHLGQAYVNPDVQQAEALRLFREKVGEQPDVIPDHWFEYLVTLTRAVSRAGGRVVLVDLPLPEWHRTISPQFAAWQRQKPAWLARAAAEGATFVDLSSTLPDSTFLDATHPLPSATAGWSRLLAEGMTRHAGR